MGRTPALRRNTRRLRHRLALAAILVAAAAPIAALSVTVDCDGGPADYGTMQDALNSLAPAGPNTVTVSGTCVETVSINGFTNLTVTSTTGATVQAASSDWVIEISDSDNVELSGLEVDATGADLGLFAFRSTLRIPSGSFTGAADTALGAYDGSVVILGGPAAGNGVSIHDNEFGAFASQSTLNLNGQVTIEDNFQDALIFSQSDGGGFGRDLGNTIRNNGFGVAILDGDRITFRGLHTVENNGPYGFFIQRAGRVTFVSFPGATTGPPYYGTTIQGHGVWGMLAVSTVVDFLGSEDAKVHVVTGNGTAPVTNDAGIWLGRQAEGRFRNMTVSSNVGSGIHGAAGAYVNLLHTAVIDNTGDGMLLADNTTGDLGSFSVADGTPAAPDATFSGNGGKNIRCVNDAVLTGDTSGISKIQCGGGGGGGGGHPLTASGAALSGTPDQETRLELHRQHLEDLVRRHVSGSGTSP